MTPSDQYSPKPSQPEGVFGIRVDYERGSTHPTRVFRAMTQLIESVEQLDHDLAWSTNAAVEPLLLLQEIKEGSLVTYLMNKFRPKKDVAPPGPAENSALLRFLIKSKRAVFNFTGTRQTVGSRSDVSSLRKELSVVAREELPLDDSLKFHPLSDARIIGNLSRIGESLANLHAHDSVSFLPPSGSETPINTGFRVSQEAVEHLLTKDRFVHTYPMILKVKKPDYLGSSRWELRHEKQVLEAHIEDEKWLRKWRSRGTRLDPGDALRAEVRSEVLYGYDGEVIKTKYDVVKVYEVIEADGSVQEELLPEEG